ncbi:hypothetical protein LS684_04200 [Cytobacillus spongiae]|uniref:hypothetical protein n=1 Tax=Cytobacillus spongiae TaxID=2901381 RepID=UPI001F38E590|nr:hypothetical protein [Cytobacillus spongiae]UII56673.1 hypothetical protein LS684_04200 [Cytobacillus spongiae]
MPQQRLYHDYVNEQLVPYLYVLTFKPCEIKWDKPVFYFDVTAPFEHFNMDEFDDSLISISISISDIVNNAAVPNKLGICLESVKNRILRHNVDPYVVTQFVVPTGYIGEVLQLLPNKRETKCLINC